MYDCIVVLIHVRNRVPKITFTCRHRKVRGRCDSWTELEALQLGDGVNLDELMTSLWNDVSLQV